MVVHRQGECKHLKTGEAMSLYGAWSNPSAYSCRTDPTFPAGEKQRAGAPCIGYFFGLERGTKTLALRLRSVNTQQQSDLGGPVAARRLLQEPEAFFVCGKWKRGV